MKKPKKITRKEMLFVDGLLQGKTQREAYFSAGYKAKSAVAADCLSSRLAKKDKVAEYFQEQSKKLQAIVEEKTETSREWTINQYREVAERCMQNAPAMYYDKVDKKMVQEMAIIEDRDGQTKEVGIYKFDARGAIGALDGIARVQGYNAPIKAETKTKHEFEQFDPSKLPMDVIVEFSNLLAKVNKLKRDTEIVAK